jgi:hypothetical protein
MRLSGLSAPGGRGGTSSWPPCTRRRCGQAALRSMPSAPRAAGSSVLGRGAGPGRSRSSSGRGRCPLPKEPGAETPGRPPRPDVQAAVVTGRRIRKRGRGPCPRTSPPHPGHRMREFLRAGNERRVRLPRHRRAGPIPAHRLAPVSAMHGRCSIMLPPRRCADPGFTPVPGQPPPGRRDRVVTPVRFPGCEPAPSGLRDCRHCPQATADPVGFAGRTAFRAAVARAPGTEPHARHTDVGLGVSAPPSGHGRVALPTVSPRARG